MTTLSISDLKEIGELVQGNDHGAAYEYAADAMGFKELAKEFADLNRRRERQGFLTMELDNRRHTLYQTMLGKAKEVLSPALYAQFYQSL